MKLLLENDLILSIASIWEMQIKIQLGKLRLRHPLRYLIENHLSRQVWKLT